MSLSEGFVSAAEALEGSDRRRLDGDRPRLDAGDVGLRVRQCNAGAEGKSR